MSVHCPVETFQALCGLPFLRHGFTVRVPGIDVRQDRETALANLASAHAQARHSLGIHNMPLICAEQVHGNGIEVVTGSTISPVPGVDGLITNEPGVALGIYVADCGAVYLVDPVKRVIALLHSGRKGTTLGITAKAVALMVEHYGSAPADIIAQLSPCVRPPHYETDFAAEIREQCSQAGIRQIHDSGICTASHLDLYYSYRAELGKTGRMLALLAMVD